MCRFLFRLAGRPVGVGADGMGEVLRVYVVHRGADRDSASPVNRVLGASRPDTRPTGL